MERWETTLIDPGSTLRDALENIDRSGQQIALVVDGSRKLLGILTDGDIRRALLKGTTLSDPVDRIMTRNPRCANEDDNQISTLQLMRTFSLQHVPVVNAEGIVVALKIASDFLLPRPRPEWVVVMAGGLGTRLKELTKDTPKPMLKLGSRPLLETIVRSFADQGFRRFYFAVNYKAEQIEAHFGDGQSLGVDIRYLRETERLGTAGPLSLLPEIPDHPIVVTNADLLIKENFAELVSAHTASGALATMGVRRYEMQVPFGVVQESSGRVSAIEEKPIQNYTVSAGVYVLDPEALKLVPKEHFFDMPMLFEKLLKKNFHVHCHRLDGYWLDIGRISDYEHAQQDFDSVFR